MKSRTEILADYQRAISEAEILKETADKIERLINSAVEDTEG